MIIILYCLLMSLITLPWFVWGVFKPSLPPSAVAWFNSKSKHKRIILTWVIAYFTLLAICSIIAVSTISTLMITS